jgi:membrane protease YdiL (CAAX protease family)
VTRPESPAGSRWPSDRAAGTGGRATRYGAAGALAAFFGLAFGLAWGWSLVLVAGDEIVRRGVGWPTHFPALIAPGLAAVIVTAWVSGSTGVADLAGRVGRWRFPLRWWVVALSPLAFLAIALVISELAGEAPELEGFGRYSGVASLGIGGVVVFALLNGFGEEIGWRGFALPVLQRRHGALRATMIIAAAWALWHLPLFLLLDSYRGFGPFTAIGFTIGIAAGSVVLTWIYNGTGGSVLAAAVWHAAYNLGAATEASEGMIAGVVSALVIGQAFVLLRREEASVRSGAAPVLGPRAPEPSHAGWRA